MTGRTTVVFDTWAWFEVLEGTPRGKALTDRYLAKDQARVLTSDISLAEAAAALASRGQADRIDTFLDDMVQASDEIVAVTRHDAHLAGLLRLELRKTSKRASLADALHLSIARNRKATLVSCDEAFAGGPDVECEDALRRGKRGA